jgi:O-antigen ligase
LVLVSGASLVPFAYQPPSYEPRILARLVAFLPQVPPGMSLYSWRAFVDIVIGFALFHTVRRVVGNSLGVLGKALGVGLSLVLVLGLAEQVGFITLDGYRAVGGELYQTRLHSLFFHSGWLAEYLVIATPFAVAAFSVRGGVARGFGVGLLVLALVAILFTQQRGAWFAALAQCGVVCALELTRLRQSPALRRRLVLFVLAVLICTGLVMTVEPTLVAPIRSRLASSFSNLSGRVNLWRSAASLVEARPGLGWGVGAFATAYDSMYPRGSPGAWPYRDTAHSLYFNVAVERGALGLAALALLGGVLLYGVWNAVKLHEPPERTLAVGLVLSGIGLAVIGLVQDPFYIRNIHWLSWLLVGAAASFCPPPDDVWVRRAAPILASLALVLSASRAVTLQPLRSSDNRSFGFHESEGAGGESMRWTTAYAVRRLPWSEGVLVVPLANGHPKALEHPVEVIVTVNGSEVSRRTLRGGWEELRLELGAPRQKWLVFELEARPTFRPFADFRRLPGGSPSFDVRSLGVAVGEIRWEAPTPAVEGQPNQGSVELGEVGRGLARLQPMPSRT